MPHLPSEVEAVLQEWAANPAAHPVVGDYRRAGYRRGKRLPPPRRVSQARHLGIRPDQPADVSPALQYALTDLGRRGGGTLQLESGRYVLDNPLFLHDSHVVLRGAGEHLTTLYFSRPLEESIGPAPSNDQSAWSWTGGQVFFVARQRLQKSLDVNFDSRSEGWLPGDLLGSLAPAPRGSYLLEVDDTRRIRPGEMVLLEVDNPGDYRLLREMSGDLPGASAYPWAEKAVPIAAGTAFGDFVTWRWPVVVSQVLNSHRIRIEQPLRITLHPETPARLRKLGPTVHDSGVENLTIENNLLPQTAHNLHPGSNGVCFQAVHDCWADNVRVLNADVAYGMTSAKSCTLSGVSAGGRSLHHFVACRVASHDNLVEDFTLEEFSTSAVPGSFLHGLNLEGLSSGNVYRRGHLSTGTFDSHRQLPFENLRTAITITNKDAVTGGAFDGGPYFGARTVHWGVEVTNNHNLGIEITDVAPRSMSTGILGLRQSGSGGLNTPFLVGTFPPPLESRLLAFGVALVGGEDLLRLQRQLAPVDDQT